MRDLARRLEEKADLIKHGELGDITDQHDVIRGLLREAAERVSLLETLLTPMAFSYVRYDDSAKVKLETEIDMADVGQFLEVLAENV